MYILDCFFNTLNNKHISWKKQLGIVMLACLIGGGNFASILVWSILLVVLLMYNIYDTHRISKSFFSYFIPYSIFTGINLLAPCNRNREWETEKSYIGTIIHSLCAAPKEYGQWLIKTPIILVLFIIGIVVWNNMNTTVISDRKRIHPVFFVVLTYLLAAAMMCPVLYAQDFYGAGRVYNVYYIVFMLLLVFDWVYIVWYAKLYMNKGKYRKSRMMYGKYLVTVSVIALIVTGFLGKYTERITDSNMRNAYANLSDGRVFQYRDIMEARLQIYAEHQGEDVVVPRTSGAYWLYLYYDLKESKEEWVNGVVADYYGVSSITPE